MAQTPQQRKANLQYARTNQNKMGKPQSALPKKEKAQKAPISNVWLYLLIFVVLGGLVFEVLRIIYHGASTML